MRREYIRETSDLQFLQLALDKGVDHPEVQKLLAEDKANEDKHSKRTIFFLFLILAVFGILLLYDNTCFYRTDYRVNEAQRAFYDKTGISAEMARTELNNVYRLKTPTLYHESKVEYVYLQANYVYQKNGFLTTDHFYYTVYIIDPVRPLKDWAATEESEARRQGW